MSRFTLLALSLGMAASVVATGGQPPADNRPVPWAPGVQAVAASSPPRSPSDEHGTFYLAPGYRVELVASEPLVQDPVAIDWDIAGRLWVVEMPGYMPDITASSEHEPTGRVVVLQDTDADGRMDHRTVFAEGLVLPRSVKVLEHGVLVGEPPDVWLMRDHDGDLRMDSKSLVTDRFGRRDIDVQNNANGFDWGLDNRIRTAGQSALHLRWTAAGLVTAPSPTRGQWGVTHDDVGRSYRNSNESALHVDLLPGEYFVRNPHLLRTRGSYERLASHDNGLNVVWPVRPTPGLNRGYQAGIRRADGTLERYTAVCSPLVYRGDRLPEAYGNVFVAEPAANLVSRLLLEPDGRGGVQARKAYQGAEFLASTDERFRPVFLSNAPDGTLTIVDMYRGVIEHRLSLTQYLRGYVEQHNLLEPRGLGRIWRVVHASTHRDTSPVGAASPESLLALLSHPNGWRRDTAQRLIVERGERRVVAGLERLVRESPATPVRLHALWTLDGLEAATPAIVRVALTDASPHVAAAAVRVAERWAADDAFRFADTVEPLALADGGLRVQAAASLGAMPDGDRKWSRVARVLRTHGTDPLVVDAALSGIRGGEADVLHHLIALADGKQPGTAAVGDDRPTLAVTTLTATVLQHGGDAVARTWLNRIADPGLPEWQREALMHGAEVGLLGAPMPGQLPPLVNPSLTCPTCPGGRLSAGGSYAFTDPATLARTATAGHTLRLTRAPDAFVALASRPSRLGKQAATVLTRVSWPGKAGSDTPPAVSLSADEQARARRGGTVYRSYCQACHEANGRGLPGRAASLVGSQLVLGAADVPTRILLHGKEGATGLMPPIGAALSDEQIAEVLTYVRRTWGHDAAAVDAATVRQVRQTTRARTRPWTDSELSALPR